MISAPDRAADRTPKGNDMPFLIMILAVIGGRIANEHHNDTAFAIFGVICVCSALYGCRRWVLGNKS